MSERETVTTAEREVLPEIVPLHEQFETRSGRWRVTMPEEPREFAMDTCVRYTYRFSLPVQESAPAVERTIIVLVPKDEVRDEHRDEEIRHMIRSRLDFSDEVETVLNPYGCPLEDR